MWTTARLGGLVLSLLLDGCTVGPKYHGPPREAVADLPARFKNAPRGAAEWRVAQSDEKDAGGAWWRVFKDPELTRMEAQSLASNQDL